MMAETPAQNTCKLVGSIGFRFWFIVNELFLVLAKVIQTFLISYCFIRKMFCMFAE
jgi:hypothetical protein